MAVSNGARFKKVVQMIAIIVINNKEYGKPSPDTLKLCNVQTVIDSMCTNV